MKWASVDTLKDEQLRLHFLYVFLCRQELDETVRLALAQLISSDTDLLLRLCDRALGGKVVMVQKTLRRYIRVRGSYRSVEARVLPFVAAMVRSRNDGVQQWIEGLLAPGSKTVRPIRDPVLRAMLVTLHQNLVN